MAVTLDDALAHCPLVAILRGLSPAEAADVGAALTAAGLRIIEVPLNSPEPLDSIRILSERHGAHALIGAGTVTTAAQVADVARAGGRLIVSPHCDGEIIRASIAAGLVPMPGVMSPTELFTACAAGATAVKLFPAELISPQTVRALRAVVPPALKLLPVGGITPESLAPYAAAGADGFGVGSALYAPGRGAQETAARARAFVAAAAGLRR